MRRRPWRGRSLRASRGNRRRPQEIGDCPRIRTATIDIEAYERLSSARKANESFSTVIKRIVKPPFDVDGYVARVTAKPLCVDAVRAIERRIRARRARSARSR